MQQVEVSTPTIQLAQGGARLYMLYWGESYEPGSSGPYQGAAGLDFAALAETYRKERYEAAEKAAEDYCWLGEENFIRWLVDKGILSSVETTNAEIAIRLSSDNAYVPKHWPACPECSNGRGEQQYGEVRRSLNRVKTFRRCTQCRHEWAYAEEANDSNKPMLKDDGRDTPGACVPFAISKACGMDFAVVLKVCTRHGWSDGGLVQGKAVVAARELGYDLAWRSWSGVGTSAAPTLKRLLIALPAGRNYVIGLKGHWLAVVDGQVVDNDNNSDMGCKVQELYEVRIAQAVAA